MDQLIRSGSAELRRFLNDNLPRLSPLWWQARVVSVLTPQQQGTVREERMTSLRQLDFAMLLRVADQNWHDIANTLNLPHAGRNLVRELQSARNRWAHQNADPLPANDVFRDADTLHRLLVLIGAAQASLDAVESIRAIALTAMANANAHALDQPAPKTNGLAQAGREPQASVRPRLVPRHATDRVNTPETRASLNTVELSSSTAAITVANLSSYASRQPATQAGDLASTRELGGLVHPREMRRREAIATVNRRYRSPILNGQNTRFANINATVDVWWLDIPVTMLTRDADIHVVLYDYRVGEPHHLLVPASYLRDRQSDLVVRRDAARNGGISLSLITKGPSCFQDTRRGVPFRQFLRVGGDRYLPTSPPALLS